jgi:L-amino acid N-acyltransferase YncA
VRQALSNGANANMQGKVGGDTALHIASRRGHAEVVRELLLNDASSDVQNLLGKTAMDLAAQAGYGDVAGVLAKPPPSAAAVRPATQDDHDQIWSILAPIMSAGETYCCVDPASTQAEVMAYWLNQSNDKHSVFVAQSNGAILGTYFIAPNHPTGMGNHVCNCGFATEQAAQGKGLCRAMLAHALVHARACGYRAMQFNFVVSTNSRAVAIWRDFGFEAVGVLPAAFNHPTEGYVDALVMHKHLV